MSESRLNQTGVTMDEQTELQELRREVAQLAGELAAMRRTLADVPDDDAGQAPVIEIADAVTRRGWMKAAAAAAVGGTALALAGSDRAAAADGSAILIGNITNTGASVTAAEHTGTTGGGVSFLFKNNYPGLEAQFPAALGGWTGSPARPTGIYGFSNVNVGAAHGVVGTANSPQGSGVLGRNNAAAGIGVTGEGGTSGVGVLGRAKTGVSALGTEYGLVATGTIGAIYIPPSNAVAPMNRTTVASPGAIDTERTDDTLGTSNLWFCVNGGSGGDWRKLAGDDTAGSLHPITPTRVYDSRLPLPSPGKLAPGANRTISVANGRSLTTGAVTVTNLVPIGARAVAYNLTLDQTELAGFLSVNPGGVVTLSASSINWSSSGQIIANGGIVGLDFSRQIKVFCGGLGATHFIVDITGYYL